MQGDCAEAPVACSEKLVGSCAAGVRLWRAAVLAAIQRQRPHDAEARAIAAHHFGCTRDVAADLLARAEASAFLRPCFTLKPYIQGSTMPLPPPHFTQLPDPRVCNGHRQLQSWPYCPKAVW